MYASNRAVRVLRAGCLAGLALITPFASAEAGPRLGAAKPADPKCIACLEGQPGPVRIGDKVKLNPQPIPPETIRGGGRLR